MKLISNFKDFYDVGRAADFEPKPVFLRERTEEIIPYKDLKRWASLGEFAKLADNSRVPWHPGFRDAGVRKVWLAFCGNLYFWYRWDEKLFASISSLREHVRSLTPPKFSYWNTNEDFGRKRLVEVFDETDALSTRGPWGCPPPTDKAWEASKLGREELPAEIFRQEGAPYFRWGSDKRDLEGHGDCSDPSLTKNPSLKNLGVFRVWDANETWQEIDQYLGNEMATQFDPNSARTDELARDYHGFDDMSFKNAAPGARKERRRQNKAAKREKA